ncbi:DUF6344 domain-containing protein [Streptomyces tropicalis]|uniref:DUF6344 domain-containing protein n=1 Tax=Streptomyces tropicalis TaxID=3034234 RepID=A0ABT6A8I1_9ACTN|nr:DUF6344 domain-containing protein [Streptomyces tropicalis]MDF3300958.1 DUF6344 domain-containing protein [Streptomyces tropicalis]
MDQNKVMKLWTAIVTAFLALCTALGIASTTTAATTAAAAPQPRPKTAPKSTANIPAQTTPLRSRVNARSLPPTIKQRIRAEAHGRTPTCRHRQLDEAAALATDPDCAPAEPPARPTIPLQR